jgi:hypothetical protein
VRFSAATALLLCVWANHAAADLYRWVDPETGSVKFSSYPPPWFGDAAREKRAPKVEHIPAGAATPAIEGLPPEAQAPVKPAAEPGAKPQAPASSAQEERRKLLLKQIGAQAATLAAVKPEEGARIYADLAERVREYNAAAAFLVQVDPGGEGARRAEWNQVVTGLDGFRRKMLEQVAAVPAPADGTPPESVRAAWLDLGRQVASFGWLDNALKLLDPKGAPARDAEQAVLIERITQQWKAVQGANLLRPTQ